MTLKNGIGNGAENGAVNEAVNEAGEVVLRRVVQEWWLQR